MDSNLSLLDGLTRSLSLLVESRHVLIGYRHPVIRVADPNKPAIFPSME